MKKTILCILDGFGLGDENYEYNAVYQANIPNLKRILQTYPHSILTTSGQAVGLPEGQMGNSEVGHMTIGAGRVIYQDLVKINKAIAYGSIFDKPALRAVKGRVHLVGLASDGGVHSHGSHLLAIANYFADAGVKVVLHLISDGRDVAPQDFINYLPNFVQSLDKRVEIGTICGRYYAMDRDKKYERTEAYFQAVYAGKGEKFEKPLDAILKAYSSGLTDEFIKPLIASNYAGVERGEAVFMVNFRADRARQIFDKFLQADKFSSRIAMTLYSEEIVGKCDVLYAKDEIKNGLCEVISNAGLSQFHIAETEKYAHVTFFFNCGREQPFVGEERVLIPSPSVSTYDLKPEMSLLEVKTEIFNQISQSKHAFIVCNIANGDMVGHSGNFEAAKKAVEAIDGFLGELELECLNSGYTALITADHGNLEEMVDRKTGTPHTQHTTGPVPLICISNGLIKSLKDGTLADIAPTVLHLLGLTKPNEMSGINLLSDYENF
jgi:2,3-bisphosphoglycerate-independent phosphoglycerate mutase